MTFVTFLIALVALVLAAMRGSASEKLTKLERRIERLEKLERSGDSAASAMPTEQRPTPNAAPSAAPTAARTTALEAALVAKEARAAYQQSVAVPEDSEVLQARVDAASVLALEPRVNTSAPQSAASAAQTRPVAARAPSSPIAELATALLGVIRNNPFASAGVLMFLIGIGFLFALLAARNILPPELRVALVALSGVAVFLVGARLEKKRSALALNLEGGALAIEYLCALWAYDGYHLITSSQAFVVLAALSSLAYGYAVFRNGVAFAFMGLAGALITPIVTSNGHGEFSDLTLYCCFITLLSATTGARLRLLMLSASTFIGTAVLLYLALPTTTGEERTVAAGLSFMAIAQLLTALSHGIKDAAKATPLGPAVVSMLLFPPLVYTGLMRESSAVSSVTAALLPAACALMLFFAAWRSHAARRASIISIAAILAFVAIGMHFRDASYAIVMSAGGLGLVIVARMLRSRFVNGIAMLYWLVSIASGYDDWMRLDNSVPFSIAALVALAAGYTTRDSITGLIYALAAPLLSGVVVLDHFDPGADHATIFMLAWAGWTSVAAPLLRWPQLKMGAWWLIPAGVALLFSGNFAFANPALAQRELVLVVWLCASAVLVRRAPAEHLAHLPRLRVYASLLVPLVLSMEVTRLVTGDLTHSLELVPALLALIWSAAVTASGVLIDSPERDQVSELACAAVIVFGGWSMLFTPLDPGHEVLLIIATGVLALHLRRRSAPLAVLRPSTGVWLLALMLLGVVFQALGRSNGSNEPVLQLLFERRMQPFVSLLWAVFGIVVVGIGSRQGLRAFWFGGAIALGLLMLKMFAVDLASLTLIAKVGTFMAVGLGLILLGYTCPLPPKEELAGEGAAV